MLETDDVDSNIVVIVNSISGHSEICNVPVQDQRFAGAGLQVMDLISIDDQIADGCLCIRAVHRNPKTVGPVT